LMRFVRRTEGIGAARKIFSQARTSPACTYHVYVASATMELCVDKDPKVEGPGTTF
jgi:cleavage stimulation factor subunit 3